mmetsp:Transcript_84003/g.166835  ORF Transcript_84003/g.166835 Transcript_84003/m.166835 type:complete len:339 (-) Transcript_84003:161-1177(-)|eukprot:CAMPEP_0172710160 /NCGR_PEP_ID=MMETSP1074-20121228/55493_1 /TAXON_ID=2916 /ORGANISM="Ceratium fusus, Strain PA161109" /LENGTH=338 /DNA_ID=CAMNT_0013533513 /DNA_START=117 /DNA_END=1133 /DNA_ORIENTATION=+
MFKAASLFEAVRGLLAIPLLASGVRDQVELSRSIQQLNKSACGHPNCGALGEYCCDDDGETVLSRTECEVVLMRYADGCEPCEDDACGFCRGPGSANEIWCGPENTVCCAQVAGSVIGLAWHGTKCSDMGLASVDGCQDNEQDEDMSDHYVTHDVFDGGNCMFDALARGLNSSLFDKPVDDMEVADRAKQMRIQAAELVLNEEAYRRDFLQSLKALPSWAYTVQTWLSARNVTDRQNFTDHNDEEFKTWIEHRWAKPPMHDGKLQGGVELYGDRLILKILGRAPGKKIQVLTDKFISDGAPVGDDMSDGLLFVRHIGQHYEAVREKGDADQLIANMHN